MKSFKKWIGIIEPEPFELISWGPVHEDLTEKQILFLEQMIDNHRKRSMNICRCDVERVLQMCGCGEVKRK